jgi:hypothetical protein
MFNIQEGGVGMSCERVWNTIINKLTEGSIELPTTPKTQKTPVWFSASTDGHSIFINRAINNKPSSQLSMERKLTYNTFQKVYPLYLRREQGEPVSREVTALTVDQVYYFSLIKHLG